MPQWEWGLHWGDRMVLELDRGCGYISLRMHSMPLNGIL